METIREDVLLAMQKEFFVDDEALRTYDEVFNQYDADRSGDIDTSELSKVCMRVIFRWFACLCACARACACV